MQLLRKFCCRATNNTGISVVRCSFSLSSLASPSFGLLAYFSSILPDLLFPAIINMFSIWVQRSLFILPRIRPPYILPPQGALVYTLLNLAGRWHLLLAGPYCTSPTLSFVSNVFLLRFRLILTTIAPPPPEPALFFNERFTAARHVLLEDVSMCFLV